MEAKILFFKPFFKAPLEKGRHEFLAYTEVIF